MRISKYILDPPRVERRGTQIVTLWLAKMCLEVIVSFVDIGRIVDHHCLEVIVSFVDIGGIIDHHCLEHLR